VGSDTEVLNAYAIVVPNVTDVAATTEPNFVPTGWRSVTDMEMAQNVTVGGRRVKAGNTEITHVVIGVVTDPTEYMLSIDCAGVRTAAAV
jgi:hypothetical protein